MRRITRETTQFELVPINNDLAVDVDWTGGIHGNSSTLVGSRIYLLGSARSTKKRNYGQEIEALCYLDVGRRTSVWRNVATPSLGTHFAFLIDDSIFVVGKYGLFQLDLLTPEWTRLETNSTPPCILTDYTCEIVAQSRQIICFGGRTETRPRSLMNITFALSIESLSWTAINPSGKSPSSREGQASCSIQGKKKTTIFLFGGWSNANLNDLHALHCSRGRYRWSQVKLNAIVDRVAYASITHVSGMLFIYGGFDATGTDSTQLVRYDTHDGTCTNFSNSVRDPISSSFHNCLAYQGAILIFPRLRYSDMSLLHAAPGEKEDD